MNGLERWCIALLVGVLPLTTFQASLAGETWKVSWPGPTAGIVAVFITLILLLLDSLRRMKLLLESRRIPIPETPSAVIVGAVITIGLAMLKYCSRSNETLALMGQLQPTWEIRGGMPGFDGVFVGFVTALLLAMRVNQLVRLVSDSSGNDLVNDGDSPAR